MSALAAAVEEYLALRRSLGFALAGIDGLLGDFVAHLEAAGLDTITTEAALAWATKPASADPSWHAKRLGYVRRFATYLHALDPRCEVPPEGLLVNRPCRAKPHLYSDSEVVALMAQARLLTPRLWAATFETFIGLLSVTGLRPGEALRLDRSHVDFDAGILRVLDSKFHDSRELPLHPSTVDALDAYARLRDELCSHPTGPAFFVAANGTRFRHGALNQTFVGLLVGAGLEPPPESGRPRPRPHDFRHSFALRSVLGWYRAGADVGALLPSLSTYLGHLNPAATYWYLSATPELLALAARRVHQRQEASR
ncbi:MAG: tyrosine-type recombinase/integrase [Acidimicrobiales bacterium]